MSLNRSVSEICLFVESISDVQRAKKGLSCEYPTFENGYASAIIHVKTALVVHQDTIEKGERERVISALVSDAETKLIHLRENIAVIEREANHLAMSGHVNDGNARDSDAKEYRSEIFSINLYIRKLNEELALYAE